MLILSLDVHMKVESQKSLEVGDLEFELGTLVTHSHPPLESLVDVTIEVIALVIQVYVEDLVEVKSE